MMGNIVINRAGAGGHSTKTGLSLLRPRNGTRMASILAQEVAEGLGVGSMIMMQMGGWSHSMEFVSAYLASVHPKVTKYGYSLRQRMTLLLLLLYANQLEASFQLPSSYGSCRIAHQVKTTYDSCPEQQRYDEYGYEHRR